jgi:hypothetical protein
MKDLITRLTPQEVAQLQAWMDSIDAIVNRFAPGLTERQRSATPAMGDRRLAFTLRSYDHAGKYPDLMTGKRSYTNFVRIYEDWKNLSRLLRRLRTILQSLDDSVLVIGSNLYLYANTFYGIVQDSQEDNIPGLTTVLQDLEVQYSNQGGKPRTEDEGNDGDSGTPNVPGNVQGPEVGPA